MARRSLERVRIVLRGAARIASRVVIAIPQDIPLSTNPHLAVMPRLRALLAVALCVFAAPAFADLWAYVDAQGRSHVANRQVDARYTLFFKGDTTLDAPEARRDERSDAVDMLARTRLYRQATDPARMQRFAPLIEANARSSGLDPALVRAVVAVESAFDPHAMSDKGAVGLMQVLPDTGERYGVRADRKRSTADKLFDPATNLRVGTRYLRDLLARFGNDLSLALAAYNAGEGAVATHANRIPPFAETRDYVRLVSALYAVYRPAASAPDRARIVVPRARSRLRYADVASE
jgi:soluble lytic murein transglycosylase-like protein